jgi:DNA-binding transcriptional LysR family regulator
LNPAVRADLRLVKKALAQLLENASKYSPSEEPITVSVQRCLAHALPGYMKANPKVLVYIEATDRTVNVIEERFDIAIRAKPVIEDVAGLVAKTLGHSQRVLVVSPAFLDQYGRPEGYFS